MIPATLTILALLTARTAWFAFTEHRYQNAPAPPTCGEPAPTVLPPSPVGRHDRIAPVVSAAPSP